MKIKKVIADLKCIVTDCTVQADTVNDFEMAWDCQDADNWNCIAEFAENAIEYIEQNDKALNRAIDLLENFTRENPIQEKAYKHVLYNDEIESIHNVLFILKGEK